MCDTYTSERQYMSADAAKMRWSQAVAEGERRHSRVWRREEASERSRTILFHGIALADTNGMTK
jgi:hypothetical protein